MQRCVKVLFCFIATISTTYSFGAEPLVDSMKSDFIFALKTGNYKDVSNFCRSRPSFKSEYFFLPDYGGKTVALLYVLSKYASATRPCDRDAYNECIVYLLDNGAEVNCCDHEGETPLHKVVKLDHLKKLCTKGADVNKENQEGITPLVRYIQNKNVPLVSCIVDQKADVFAKDFQGNNPFFHAIAQRSIPIIDILFLRIKDCDTNHFNSPNHSAETPIGLALKSGQAVSETVCKHVTVYLQNLLTRDKYEVVCSFVKKYQTFDYKPIVQWIREQHSDKNHETVDVQKMGILAILEKCVEINGKK